MKGEMGVAALETKYCRVQLLVLVGVQAFNRISGIHTAGSGPALE